MGLVLKYYKENPFSKWSANYPFFPKWYTYSTLGKPDVPGNKGQQAPACV